MLMYQLNPRLSARDPVKAGIAEKALALEGVFTNKLVVKGLTAGVV